MTLAATHPAEAQAGLRLVLSTNQSIFGAGSGQSLSPVFGRLSQAASMRSVLSVTLSAGLGVVIPEFFRYTWQGNEPFGTYQMLFAATRPGAFNDGRIDGGDIRAVQIAPFSVRPPATVTADTARATTTLVPITGALSWRRRPMARPSHCACLAAPWTRQPPSRSRLWWR